MKVDQNGDRGSSFRGATCGPPHHTPSAMGGHLSLGSSAAHVFHRWGCSALVPTWSSVPELQLHSVQHGSKSQTPQPSHTRCRTELLLVCSLLLALRLMSLMLGLGRGLLLGQRLAWLPRLHAYPAHSTVERTALSDHFRLQGGCFLPSSLPFYGRKDSMAMTRCCLCDILGLCQLVTDMEMRSNARHAVISCSGQNPRLRLNGGLSPRRSWPEPCSSRQRGGQCWGPHVPGIRPPRPLWSLDTPGMAPIGLGVAMPMCAPNPRK